MTSKLELIENLKQDIIKNLDCSLKNNSTNLVFGKGNIDAELFFIGEAPGEKEDLQGIPFVGRAGKQLDLYLNKIGLSLDEVYIANILKYRPPKNRNPTMSEVKNHTPYLIEQIKIIKPKFIIPMGNFASKFVLSNFDTKNMNKIDGISNHHGKVYEILYDDIKFKVFPMYHPAAILYRSRLKEEFETDFIKLKGLL